MSERYRECNRRVFQTTADELTALLGIYIMLGITRLPTINNHWTLEKGLGNPLIQKMMKREGF